MSMRAAIAFVGVVGLAVGAGGVVLVTMSRAPCPQIAPAAGTDDREVEHCSKLQQDAETRIGGQCKDHALEQSRLFATEAWKHLPENEIDRVGTTKVEEIYAVADAPDPDAAITDHIRKLECERWLNHSRMQ